MLPFEFVVFDRPRSQGSSNAQRGGPWQTKVKNAAAARWGTQPPVADALAVSIAYLSVNFQPGGSHPDIDNIAKPIVDALEGLIYINDAAVTDVLCRRRDLYGDLQILHPSQLLLVSAMRNVEFVHVIVDNAPVREVHL